MKMRCAVSRRQRRGRRVSRRKLRSLCNANDRALTRYRTPAGAGSGFRGSYRDGGGGSTRGGSAAPGGTIPQRATCAACTSPSGAWKRTRQAFESLDPSSPPEDKDLRAITPRPRPRLVADHRAPRREATRSRLQDIERTHSRPFYFLERLQHGDRIHIAYRGRNYVYRVARSRVLSSANLHIADAVGHERVLLSACTPRGSAEFRLVVEALPGVARQLGRPWERGWGLEEGKQQ